MEYIGKSRISHITHPRYTYDTPMLFASAIGMGNNPMVGATVAVAVAIEEACK